MTGWLIALKILVLCLALYSYLSYKSRRSENDAAMQRLRRAPVLRALDAEETQALQPLRIAGGLTWGDEVRALSGVFIRHGLDANGHHTVHDTIGDVDVVLPYDAPDFLEPHNVAEVVMSSKAAIVVRLNGFNIVEGRARSLQPGATAAAADTTGLPPPMPVAAEAMAAPPVTVLEDRKESPEEAALGAAGGPRWPVAGLWALAFVLLAVAAWTGADGARMPALLLALAAAGLAIFWQWRPRARARPPLRAVKRLQGQLSMVDLPDPTNAMQRHQHYFLGDTQRLQVPEHWQRSGRLPVGQTVQLDVAATSGDVLALGKGWSLADEARRFPDKGWGRHAVLAGVAVLALVVYAVGSDGPFKDLSLAWQGLRGGETRSDATAASLVQRPPQAGDRVRLRGQGECELALTPMDDSDVAIVLPDCSRMRWGGQPTALPALQVPAPWVSLYRGDFITVREDNVSAMLLRMMMMQAGDDAYAQAAMAARAGSSKQVGGLGGMIDTVEQACVAGLPDCEALQRGIVDQFGATIEVDGQDVALDTWPALARELRKAAEEQADSLRMSSAAVRDLQHMARRHAGTGIAQSLQQHALQLLSLQRGGVVLDTPYDLRPNPEQQNDRSSGLTADTVLDRWDAGVATLATAIPFTVEGLVLGRDSDSAGLRLQVDPEASPSRVQAALASSLWFLLALGLLLVSSVLLWRGIVAAQARRRALDTDMQARPTPGLPY